MYGLFLFALLATASAQQYGSYGAPVVAPASLQLAAPAPLQFAAPAPLQFAAPAPVAVPAPAPLPIAAPAPVALSAPVAFAAPVQQSYGPIEAAVHTRRTFEVRPVLVEQALGQPQVIDISPNYEAVQIHFRTASSRLNAIQSHEAGVGAVEHTASQDAPHRLVHDINKPVIQEVREVIQPFRRITQEIKPVIEEIHTIVHKGERRVPIAVPLPIRAYAPAYGPGAAIAANAGYKAKAA